MQRSFLILVVVRRDLTDHIKQYSNCNSVYFIVYSFGQRMQIKIFRTDTYQAFPEFTLLLDSSQMQFLFVRLLLRIWTSQYFRSIYYLCLYCDSVLHSVQKTWTHFIFLTLPSWLASILLNLLCFFCSIYIFTNKLT